MPTDLILNKYPLDLNKDNQSRLWKDSLKRQNFWWWEPKPAMLASYYLFDFILPAWDCKSQSNTRSLLKCTENITRLQLYYFFTMQLII